MRTLAILAAFYFALSNSLALGEEVCTDDISPTECAALLTEQAALVNARAALATARAAEIEAQNSLQNALLLSPDDRERLAQLEIDNSLLSEQKKKLQNEKDINVAEVQKVTAPLDEISASDLKGTVALKDKAGVLEANLLAASALQLAANKVAKQIEDLDADHQAYLVVSEGQSNFERTLSAFNVTRNQFFRVVDQAVDIESFSKVENDFLELEGKFIEITGELSGEQESLTSTMAIAGGLLEAGSKLISYFKTDYELGGVSLTPSNSLFSNLVAGRIGGRVSTIQALGWANGSDEFEANLRGAERRMDTVREHHSKILTLEAKIQALKLRIQNSDTLNANQKAELLAAADGLAAGLSAEKAKVAEAQKAYSAFITAFATPDSDVYITKMVPALAYRAFKTLYVSEDDGATYEQVTLDVLIVDVNVSFLGGTYYTKRNIGTGLGGMPYEAAGGAVVYSTLIDSSSGAIVSSEVFPIHGGYKDIDDIAKDTRFKFEQVEAESS